MPAGAVDPTTFECVEIYIPKKLEHLSELFNYLRKKLTDRDSAAHQAVPIDGFSIYEVDGAFYGAQFYQERTIVVRILFSRPADDDGESLRRRISALGSEVAATVAMSEEQVWICHYPQGVVIIRPRDNPAP
jgi:hypothetical protein